VKRERMKRTTSLLIEKEKRKEDVNERDRRAQREKVRREEYILAIICE